MFKKCMKWMAVGVLAMSIGVVAQAKATKKELVVATNFGFVPFEFTENGKYVGFDVELIEAIAKKLGWKYKWRAMEFGGLVAALQTGNVDVVIAAMTINEKRQRAVDFSQPYYESGVSIMTRAADAKKYRTAKDLAGKVVAVQTGTVAVDFLKKEVPTAKIAYFPQVDNAYLDLLTGRADVVLHDTPNVQYYAATAGKGKVAITGHLVTGDFYGIALPKGSPLVAQVNKALDELKLDGTYQKIYNKWFGSQH